ncbi:hypothetical protein [Sphingomonas sp.]|jgi:hypothetical protein|uniref:hypothetical protein n=1 Tax=Sphingomonas sp. TaxID=28214 RepID=UPI0035673AED
MDRDNQQDTATEAEVAWLAGIIEGDGTLSLSMSCRVERAAPKVSVTVKLYNTDGFVIKKAIEILDKMGVRTYLNEREQKPMLKQGGGEYTSRDSMLTITVNKMESSHRLLERIRPWLFGNKAARADLMTRYLIGRFDKFAKNGGYKQVALGQDDVDTVKDFYKLTNPNKSCRMHASTSRFLNDYTRCVPETAKDIV